MRDRAAGVLREPMVPAACRTRAYLEVRDSIATNMSTLQEGLEGIRVVQAYGREGSFTDRFAETNEAQFQTNLVTVRISSLYFPAIEYAGVVGTAVIIGVGGWLSSRVGDLGRNRRRVRALPAEPVRPGAAAQPALQHRAVGGGRAAQGVRAARRAPVGVGEAGRGRPADGTERSTRSTSRSRTSTRSCCAT